MILLDMSHVSIVAIMQTPEIKNRLNPNLVRHLFLNILQTYKSRFGKHYGEVVICCDSNRYWRREVFPYYKAGRKENRDKSPYDWKTIFDTIVEMKSEMKEYFPYKVIEVPGAEADDIIAVLAMNATEPTLILSSDKDFKQLLSNPLVDQYSITGKRFIDNVNVEETLLEHIITGDRGDGIPNVISDSDCFVMKKRQSPMTAKRLAAIRESYLSCNLSDHPLRTQEGFRRNQTLIDFRYIPDEIKQSILTAYQEYPKTAPRSKIMAYFMKHNMSELLGLIGNF